MNRKWINITLGLGALALTGILCQALAIAQKRRAKLEQQERVSTWEDEGGAVLPEAR